MEFIRGINENILDDLEIKYDMRDGEVTTSSGVDLSGRDLTEIDVKFGRVNGTIDVSGNKLETFEFLPYEAKKYILSNNPGVTGKFGHVVDICSGSDAFTDLFNKFIYECLDNDVWYHGGTNQDIIPMLWTEVKLNYYNGGEENKNRLLYSMVDAIDLNDIDILADFFNLDRKSIRDSDNFIDAIIDNLKSEDGEVRFHTYTIINSLARGGGKRVKTMFINRDLEDTYNKLRRQDISDIGEWSGRQTKSRVDALLKMMHRKMTRSPEEKERDDRYDCFVFNGKESFGKNDSGSYDKKFEIESMIKVDPYNLDHNHSVTMMKIRARSQGDIQTYIIRMEKDMMDMLADDEEDEGKEVWHNHDIPDYMLRLFDEHKQRI